MSPRPLTRSASRTSWRTASSPSRASATATVKCPACTGRGVDICACFQNTHQEICLQYFYKDSHWLYLWKRIKLFNRFVFKMAFSAGTRSNISRSTGTGTVFQQMSPGSSRAAVVAALHPVMVPLTWEMLLTRKCRETPEPAPPCC